MRFEAPVKNQTWVLMGALDIYKVNKMVEFRTTCLIPPLLFLQLASRLPVCTRLEVGTKPAVQPVSLQIGTITVNIAPAELRGNGPPHYLSGKLQSHTVDCAFPLCLLEVVYFKVLYSLLWLYNP